MVKDLKAVDLPQLFCANTIPPLTNEAFLSYACLGSMLRQEIF